MSEATNEAFPVRMNLRVVFYREGEAWIAHCLETDLIGDGETREAALESLKQATVIQLEFVRNQRESGDRDLRNFFTAAEPHVEGSEDSALLIIEGHEDMP